MEKLSLWGSSAEKEKEDDKEHGLDTLLTDDERGEVFRLVGAVTEAMRTSIKTNLSTQLKTDSSRGQAGPEQHMPSTSSVQNTSGASLEGQEESSLAAALSKLGDTLLQFFDQWQSSVTLRLGEVLNSREATKHHNHHRSAETQSHDSSPAVDHLERDLATEKVFRQVYPPIPTTLSDASKDKRVLILHSMLLMLLSLEHYVAYSRVLLLRLTSSLEVSLSVLEEDEQKVAQGLSEAAKHMSGDEVAKKRAEENKDARLWKVGIASVAGAALIGVTGGLAAPLVAAGIGGVMGGLGLGATAAAGYLGTLAGSSVLVGGLFGAYGGRMTGKMMDSYAREIEDFAFVPVRGGKKRGWSNPHEATSEDRRLRVTVAISGWLTDKEEVIRPWHVLGHHAETFALRYELDVLLGLGNALTSMVKSAAWGYAKAEIIKRTIFASLTAALWPLGLLKIGRVVDNPFSVAKARSDKAGTILADALINRVQGERPVTLIGYSLGARVIYSCLKSLAERDAFGLVESAVLMGAPTPSVATEWRMMRTVVAGRLVNIYSENDYILGFLYRTSSIQLGIAGLQSVEDVPSVENVDVSDIVDGHLRYRYVVGSILKRVGFEDVDPAEIDREEQAMRVIESEEEQTEKEWGSGQSKEYTEFNADEDVKHLESEIQTKNQQTFTRTDESGKHPDTAVARE